jgi:hypothetical protein
LAALTNVFILVSGGETSAGALVRGYSAVFIGSATAMVAAALIAVLLIPRSSSVEGPAAGPSADKALMMH